MKKIISLLCLLSLLVGVFASCELLNIGKHEHVFSEEWTTDTDYHWRACTVNEKCDAYTERALHDFAVDLDESGKTVNVCKVCGYKNDRVNTAPEHEHTFGTEYTSSDNFHWYECTVEGCFETSKSREHEFSNPESNYANGQMTLTYTCVDCGFVKTQTSTVDAKVDSAVEWDAIFDSFKLTNFTMDVYITYEGQSQHNHCIVDKDAIYYHIPDNVEMYIAKINGEWVGYCQDEYDTENDKFYVMDETQDELEEMCVEFTRETVVQISFSENFDKFVYNEAEGTYTCAQTIEATYYDNDGTVAGTLYCFNSVVKVVDGQIIYISSDYNFGHEGDTAVYRFVYSNIGMSEVGIPQAVIDEAKSK